MTIASYYFNLVSIILLSHNILSHGGMVNNWAGKASDSNLRKNPVAATAEP